MPSHRRNGRVAGWHLDEDGVEDRGLVGLAAGEHPKIAAERVGHSKVTLTLDTYSRVLPGLEERAAERLEAVVGYQPPQEMRSR